MTKQFQRRFCEFAPPTVEAWGAQGQPRITGYASVFNQASTHVREQVAEGAFRKSLAEADVRALFNHDTSKVLGRTRSGTLHLSEDAHGLKTEIFPPSGVTWVDDLLTSMRRGDINGMSIGFRPLRWKTGKDGITVLTEIQLIEVSVVTLPAFEQTEAVVRAIGSHRERLARLKRAVDLAEAELLVRG